jgi:hypothetical protein
MQPQEKPSPAVYLKYVPLDGWLRNWLPGVKKYLWSAPINLRFRRQPIKTPKEEVNSN